MRSVNSCSQICVIYPFSLHQNKKEEILKISGQLNIAKPKGVVVLEKVA